MKRRAMIAAGTFVISAGTGWMSAGGESARACATGAVDGPELSRRDGIVAVGVVEPQYKTNLAFRVLGRLTGRPVSVGDFVSEGQTVGAIDSTALELAVRSAKAELTKAEAPLATAKATEERQRTSSQPTPPQRQTLDNAEQARAGAAASVAHAQANLIKAHRATGLCPAQGRFRRRRHCGGRRSRTGGLSWPNCRDGREA